MAQTFVAGHCYSICRLQQISRIKEVDLAAEIKIVEILYARRIAQRQLLQNFLFTSHTTPAVYWRPARPSPVTDALFAARDAEFEAWKVCGPIACACMLTFPCYKLLGLC